VCAKSSIFTPPYLFPADTYSLNKTMEELKSRGVEFTDEITNEGYGLVTHFKMPGEVKVQLYQPLYSKK